MKVHHLNCGTMCPLAGRFVEGTGGLFSRGQRVCHCLLLETSAGLVLVETGLGSNDLARPARRLGVPFVALTSPQLDPEETALAQVKRLGFSPEDVRHIVLTHGHCDHAGGIDDFPHATVHLYADEHAAMTAPATGHERSVYRPQQWAHGPRWAAHKDSGDRWHGFSAVRAVEGLEPEILLLPMPGHTRGHAAVAVQTRDRVLIHAGDLYMHRDQLDPQLGSPPLALRVFHCVVDFDSDQRLSNLARLRELQREQPAFEIFCAHDPVELERMRTHTAQRSQPAARPGVTAAPA